MYEKDNLHWGLVHAFVLDGRGGARSLEWEQLERLQLAEQESLWLHWDRGHPQTHGWLREHSGLSDFSCDLLLEENVGQMDLFLALTSDDEDNIMSAMLAKRLGAGRVMSLINRRAYADMMQGSTIDIALSPAQTVIGELLTHLRRGDVVAVHSLRRGAAEALEGVARGDVKTSKLVGRKVEEIKLPKGTRIGAIVRGEGRKSEVLMPHHDTVIETDDHVIIFIPNKRLVREVEKLFQVSATFFG